MTGIESDAHVSVIQSGQFATIGRVEAPTGLLQSTLDLPGGLLTYDVRDISTPPFAEIDDPSAAVHWVARVYGASAAGQLESPPSEMDTGATTATEHHYSPDLSAANLARVALGQWLWRYWPATDPREVPSLDEQLLRLELAALAWRLDDYFTALQPATIFLHGTLETLHELATRVADDPNVTNEPLKGIVVGALDAAAAGPSGALLTEDENLLESLDELLTRIMGNRREDADAVDSVESVEEWLRERAEARAKSPTTARRADYALTAGGEEDSALPNPRCGRFSVDWMQVPPRCLDWGEDTIRWVAEPVGDAEDGWHLTIRVAASHPPSDSGESILARAYVPDGTAVGNLPALTIRLLREGHDYVGSGPLQCVDLGALAVDVFSTSSVRQPLIGPAARDGARREREEARQLIVNRFLSLGVPSEGPDRRFEGEPHQDA